jgi:signal transduction histidine kinase
MSLRSKIVLILVTVVVLYAAAESVSSRLLAGRFFSRWEHQEAEKDLARVRERLDGVLAELGGKARILAGIDGLASFAAGGEPGFAERDLGPRALADAEVDLYYVCDPSGKVRWGSVQDPATHEPMRLQEFPREALASGHPALRFQDAEREVSGVLMTKVHPLLFSSRPIADASGEEWSGTGEARHPLHGTLIVGRFLDPELERQIVGGDPASTATEGVAATRCIELLESNDPALPDEVKRSDEARVLLVGEDSLLHAYERIAALRTGEPIVLHVALDRTIEAYKRTSVNYLLLTTLIGGCLVLLVLLRLLQGNVIVPLSTLTAKAMEIGRRDDTTIRVGLQRSDEIGQLAGEFDRMLGKLAKSREQVIETARLAGMSEIATGVLHNVGNVLNSVNVSANLATKKTEELSLGDLETLVGVLTGHERDLAAFVGQDPRGKHLVPFLKELSAALGSQRRAIQDEMRSLNQGIEHIAELVRAQQSHAGSKGVFEKAVLAEQLEAALSICKQGLGACGNLQIERDFGELPAVRVDKHKLMEILVNVIQNAGQALAEHGGTDPRLTLRISRSDPHTARIEVRDNGVGIPRENLTRVFQHGFTTKKNGHGFGLHVSANAATEMGAKLFAVSDGAGRGAAFFLDVPIEAEVALQAA